MPLHFFKIPLSTHREKGVALVVVLLSLVLFVTLVTGFLVATRLENMASRNFSYQNISRHMAFTAAQHALAQINQASTNEILLTRPGLITTILNGNISEIPFSSAANANAGTTNVFFNAQGILNTNTNNLYFSAPEVQETPPPGQNYVSGRFAYWVDDDGSKANLNAMTPGSRTNFTATNSRPFGTAFFRSNITNTNHTLPRTFAMTLYSNSPSSNMWSYYINEHQIIYLTNTSTLTTNNYRRFKADIFELSAGPNNLTNAPPWFTTNRINLNTQLDAINIGGGRFARNFLTNAASGAALTTEIDDLIRDKIDRASITNQFGSGFVRKYGRDALRQIVVNINDLHLASSSNSSTPIPTTGFANTNSDGIPTLYSGLRDFVYLNEVATRVAYNPRTLPITGQGNSSCEVQIWLKFELINPFSISMGNQTAIAFNIDNFSATATYVSSNGTPGSATLSRATVPALGPQSGTTVVNQNVPPRSYLPTSGTTGTSTSGNLTFGLEYQFYEGPDPFNTPPGATAITVTNVSFQISFVKLLQSAGSNETIRDWAIAQDFAGHGAANGTLTFSGASVPQVTTSLKQGNRDTLNFQVPDTVIEDFNSGSVLGIAKNDPRVRRFPDWATPITAWLPVFGNGNSSLTFGSQNSVVNFTVSSGISGISPDRSSGNFSDHFIWSSNFTSSNQSYRTLTDLGRVHTGLQWRTLHMAAQNPSEASVIPDWALLESFYTTNSIPKLNVNSAQQSASGTPSLSTQASDGILRSTPFASLLAGGTNTPVGFPTNAGFTDSSTLNNLASNVSQMRFNPRWSSVRTSRASFFPQNAYSMIGEVLEVQGLTDITTLSDAANEGRAATFLDAISTTSDVFSIYSVGYAVDRQGRDVGEYRLRTQVAFNPTKNRFEAVYAEPVFVP